MPIHMRLPKRGFKNPFRLDFNTVNIGRVQAAIDAGKLDKGARIDAAALIAAGVIRRAKDGVRLLGNGELKAKLDFEVAGVSAGAKAAVEKAGGSVTVVEPKAKKAAAE
jgi:large subunit ribosomal protein L15